MSIPFSDTVTNTGIVQQARDMMRVDATQWATQKIANSVNNYLDKVTGYAIATDRRFQWDDTNQTKLPIGTTPITASSDYSFLLDEQGNSIITLTRIEYATSGNARSVLMELDESEEGDALGTVVSAGVPTGYYKIADNVIRLNKIPPNGTLTFYFQRTGSYFLASDTTKSPGVSPLLHRGFVIAAAYDGALTLGLSNLPGLSAEMIREENKMIKYFSDRNMDVRNNMQPKVEDTK